MTTKLRYRVRRWGSLQPGEVVVLYSWNVARHWVMKEERPPCYIEGRNIRFTQADDVVIYRDCAVPEDEMCFVLDSKHHADIVSALSEDERWAQIHAEYEKEDFKGDDDDAE